MRWTWVDMLGEAFGVAPELAGPDTAAAGACAVAVAGGALATVGEVGAAGALGVVAGVSLGEGGDGDVSGSDGLSEIERR